MLRDTELQRLTLPGNASGALVDRSRGWLCLNPPRRRGSVPEPIVYHRSQLDRILAACHPGFPQQELVVRLLVGSGVRTPELCQLAMGDLDGLPDLRVDPAGGGWPALRVRWEGAKGARVRWVPIAPGLAMAIERYRARRRPPTDSPSLVVSARGRPYRPAGIDSMLDRLQAKVGFRVHAQAFRRTFAAVACQLGWRLERLRAALGHADSRPLWSYLRLAAEHDLGRRNEWAELVLDPGGPAR